MSRTTLLTMTGTALVAALASGIGWVAASAEPGTATHAGAAPAPRTADPPPPPPAVAPAAEKESDETKRAKQSAALEKRIAQAQQLLDRDAIGAASSVDVAALQAELIAIDTKILQTENVERTERASIEDITKRRESESSRTYTDVELTSAIENLPTVQKARSRIRTAQIALENLSQTLLPDHAVMKAAAKEVAEATAELDEARKEARKDAESSMRTNSKNYYETIARQLEADIGRSQRQIQELHVQRQTLVKRITTQRQREAKRDQLQDELRLLYQIRMDLLRQEMLSTLGLQPPAQSGGSTQMEAEVKDLRRQIERLCGEVEKLRAGKKN